MVLFSTYSMTSRDFENSRNPVFLQRLSMFLSYVCIATGSTGRTSHSDEHCVRHPTLHDSQLGVSGMQWTNLSMLYNDLNGQVDRPNVHESDPTLTAQGQHVGTLVCSYTQCHGNCH